MFGIALKLAFVARSWAFNEDYYVYFALIKCMLFTNSRLLWGGACIILYLEYIIKLASNMQQLLVLV